MIRIRKIGVKQTAKFFAIFYFFISLVFVLPMALIFSLIGWDSAEGEAAAGFGGLFLIFVPLLYAAAGFIVVALFSVFYNFLAKRFGGVEVELDSEVASEK